MALSKEKKDRSLIAIIVVVSVAGLLYFGIKAISEDSQKGQENPFAYDIERFKHSGADLIHYAEVHRVDILMPLAHGIAIGPDDTLYIAGDNKVIGLNRDGRLKTSISITEKAHCLAVDKNHNIYLGMNDHVEVFDNNGIEKAIWDSIGEDAIITSVAVSNDNVFVADAGNHIVWKFNKAGQDKQRIGDKDAAKDIPGFVIPSPYFDVDIDPDGFLWVANTGMHSLENYTTTGDLRSSWGEFSMEVEGFCGCCNPSHFSILEDGSFVTSEKGIARVKIYNRLGELVSVVASPDQFQEGTVGLDLAVDSEQRIYVLDPVQKAIRVYAKKTDQDG